MKLLDRIFRSRSLKTPIDMVVYDALLVEAPCEEETELRQLVTKMMTAAAKLDMLWEVDIEGSALPQLR
jgi:DNA polymerase I-like protein with 3'-5' exonuclease and polymerase domains